MSESTGVYHNAGRRKGSKNKRYWELLEPEECPNPDLEWDDVPLAKVEGTQQTYEPVWHRNAVKFYVAAQKNSVTEHWEQSDVVECWSIAELTDTYFKSGEQNASMWDKITQGKRQIGLLVASKRYFKLERGIDEEDGADARVSKPYQDIFTR